MDYWIVGGAGVFGFLAFLVSRVVVPCKPCKMESPDFTQIKLSSEPNKSEDSFGNVSHAAMSAGHRVSSLLSGERRIVHVNRQAISENMKHGDTYPTCVVIDKLGVKHQFHYLVIHGESSLGFDPDNAEANVYISTFAKITGVLEKDKKQQFVASEPKPKKKIWKDRLRPVIRNTPIVGCFMED